MNNSKEQKAAFVCFCGLHLRHRTNNPSLTPLFISLHPFKGLEEEQNEEGSFVEMETFALPLLPELHILTLHLQSVISRPYRQSHDLFNRLNNKVSHLRLRQGNQKSTPV